MDKAAPPSEALPKFDKFDKYNKNLSFPWPVVTQVVTFWSEVLSGPLNSALQNEQNPKLQMSTCDALSTIPPQAFAQLPVSPVMFLHKLDVILLSWTPSFLTCSLTLKEKTQLMCVTVLLGLSYSENHQVKTASVRALGVFILFPCLREVSAAAAQQHINDGMELNWQSLNIVMKNKMNKLIAQLTPHYAQQNTVIMLHFSKWMTSDSIDGSKFNAVPQKKNAPKVYKPTWQHKNREQKQHKSTHWYTAYTTNKGEKVRHNLLLYTIIPLQCMWETLNWPFFTSDFALFGYTWPHTYCHILAMLFTEYLLATLFSVRCKSGSRKQRNCAHNITQSMNYSAI